MNQNIGIKDLIFITLFSTLVFFGAFFLFTSLKGPSVHKTVSVRHLDKNISRKVNKKIQKLHTRDQILKSRMKRMKTFEASDLEDSYTPPAEDNRFALDVYEQKLGAEEKVPETASEKVMALLNSEERSAREKSEMLLKYKAELIEKARKQGWAIELSDDLEVVSAQEI